MEDGSRIKWRTFGPQYELLYSQVGFNFANGYDEQPLIHFEDLPAEILYKVYGKLDFRSGYSFGAAVSWTTPLRGHLPPINVIFDQRKLDQNNLFIRTVGLSSKKHLQFADLSLIAKFNHQRLNGSEDPGFGVGLERSHRRFYYGASADYFPDHFNYSVYLQSFFFNYKTSARLSYERIGPYDFINVGVNYIIFKTIEE